MISYQQAMEDQRNLERLCAPKQSTNPEIYGPNNNYGFASILKQYSDYPKNKPIMALIPHGIYLNERNIFPGELNAPLPGVLNYPPFRMAAWKKMAKKKKIIASSSPFLYALKLFKNEFPKADRKGSLYFPPHSTVMNQVTFDKEELLLRLKNFSTEFHPITICMHWYDITQGLHEFFLSHGFNVVSAGHIYDESFIFRWLHIVNQFKFTLSSSLGSSLFYSIAAGIPHRLICLDVKHNFSHRFKTEKKVAKKMAIERSQKLWLLFNNTDYNDANTDISIEKQELINYCLGKASLKQPKALLKILQNLS